MKKIKQFFRILYYLSSYLQFRRFGENVHLSKKGRIVNPKGISFGNNVFIAQNFFISAGELEFGNNIMIGPNLVIECSNHTSNVVGKTMMEINNQKIRKKISIENDVWLGANVVLLPGVTISEGSVVGAGSIVTKTLPPYSICVGNPCRPIKKRFSNSEMQRHLEKIKSKYSYNEITFSWSKNNLVEK